MSQPKNALSAESAGPMFTPAMWGLLLAALAAVAGWPSMMLRPNEYDSCIFMWMGGRMWHGQLPYRDLWDNKLPLLYWINATAALTGSPKIAIYLMQAVAVAAGGLLIYGIGRRLFSECPARVASVAYVTLAATPAMLETGNFTETWAAPFVILCVYALVRYADADRAASEPAPIRWPMLSGLGMGTAVSLRQPAILVGAVLFVLLPALWRVRRLTISAVTAWLFGLLLVPVLMLGWAYAAGVRQQMFEQCIAFNFAYGTSADRPDWATWSHLWVRFTSAVGNTWPWHLAAAGGAAVLVVGPVAVGLARPRQVELSGQPVRPDRPIGAVTAALIVLAWALSAGASSLPSLRFYVHHYYFAAAPLALLAGAAFAPLFSRNGRGGMPRLLGGAVLAAVLGLAVFEHYEGQLNAVTWKAREAKQVEKVAEYLAGQVDPQTQTLYALVWGPQSDLLPRLGMASPTRHVMVVFYTELHTGEQMVRQWRDEMLDNPPDWLVCQEDLDLVTDHRPGGVGPGRWTKGFNWNQARWAKYLDEVHAAYAWSYDRVAAFDSAPSKGADQPDPGRLIIYRKRPTWQIE